MRYVPSEKEMRQKINLVEVMVVGSYIAMLDEKRKIKRPYKIKVAVPENFNLSDIKRLTPRALMNDEKYSQDFVAIRTFEHDKGVPIKKTGKTILREKLYTEAELLRMDRLRARMNGGDPEEKGIRGDIDKGIPGDVSEYDPNTGLPPVINDGPIVVE